MFYENFMLKKQLKWERVARKEALEKAIGEVTKSEARAAHGKRAFSLVFGTEMEVKR